MPRVLVLRGRGVLGPHAAEAVGHQLDAHARRCWHPAGPAGPGRAGRGCPGCGARTRGRSTYSWASGPPLEPNWSLEDLEEAGVDVDLLVERAVERAHLVAGGAARRLGLAVVEDRLRRRVLACRTCGSSAAQNACTELTVPMTRQLVFLLASAPVLHCWNASVAAGPRLPPGLVRGRCRLAPAVGSPPPALIPKIRVMISRMMPPMPATDDHAARGAAAAPARPRPGRCPAVTLSLKLIRASVRRGASAARRARRHLG